MEVETLSDTTSDDLKAAIKELTADVKAVTKYSETLDLAIDDIGRFLLNEDGSTRDFTNKELMDKTAKKVDAGLKQMNANAENIGTKIGQIPQTIPAELSLDSKIRIAKVSVNAKLAIIVFVLFFVITAGCVAYATSLAADVKGRSEKLNQWYEDNQESILFGRYVRWNYNDLWKKLHDKWVSDPGLKDDMFDYFQIEERNVNKEKK
jgi:hypothetical protein